MKKALKIIEIALMNYVNDSAGESSEETKEIQEAWNKVSNLPIDSIEELVNYVNSNNCEERQYETYAFEQGIDPQIENVDKMDENHIYTHIRRIEESL